MAAGSSDPGARLRADVLLRVLPAEDRGAQLSLGQTIAELEPLGPSFVSVTYGAGGSTRERTHECHLDPAGDGDDPMAHLTCAGHTPRRARRDPRRYRDAGIENILALGGDPPPDAADRRRATSATRPSWSRSSERRPRSRSAWPRTPRCHPRSPDRTSDRRHLAAKLRAGRLRDHPVLLRPEHYLAWSTSWPRSA